jgi:hypothetical protein
MKGTRLVFHILNNPKNETRRLYVIQECPYGTFLEVKEDESCVFETPLAMLSSRFEVTCDEAGLFYFAHWETGNLLQNISVETTICTTKERKGNTGWKLKFTDKNQGVSESSILYRILVYGTLFGLLIAFVANQIKVDQDSNQGRFYRIIIIIHSFKHHWLTYFQVFCL